MNNQQESTYALLVRSEEKSRGVLETILYALFIFSALILLWQFAQQPVKVSAAGLQLTRCTGKPFVCRSRPIEKNEPPT